MDEKAKNVGKIIQITSEIVTIGMADGSLKDVSFKELTFVPSVGDEVQVFQNDDRIIVTKIEKKPETVPVQQVYQQPQPIVINNSNNNVNQNTVVVRGMGKEKNKWVAFLLCLFLGVIGAHKFYEGKIGMGILYIFTVGLFGIGVVIDLIAILFKPNPYYV